MELQVHGPERDEIMILRIGRRNSEKVTSGRRTKCVIGLSRDQRLSSDLPARQWLAAEHGFCSPCAEIDGEGHAVAGERANDSGVWEAGMSAEDGLPIVGEKHRAAPPMAEFDGAQSGMQAADAAFDGGD